MFLNFNENESIWKQNEKIIENCWVFELISMNKQKEQKYLDDLKINNIKLPQKSKLKKDIIHK